METALKDNLEELFQFSDLPEDEKALLLADIGGLILESSATRFIAESDESTMEHFARMVGAYADKDELPGILAETFPAFATILEEEAEAFREDAVRILNKQG